MLTGEVNSCIYRIDMMLDLKINGLTSFAIEVQNFKAKNFRNEYDNPSSRLKRKILIKNGLSPIDIDTR